MITEKELNCIEQTLLNYRLSGMYVRGDKDDAYPLVDLLTPKGKNITAGEAEIVDIMADIYLDLRDLYATEQRTKVIFLDVDGVLNNQMFLEMIKKYDIVYDGSHGHMEMINDGDYVLYEDIKHLLERPGNSDYTKEINMSAEYKPCPFCGSKNIEYNNDTGPSDEGFGEWIECEDCCAKCPDEETWNRRTNAMECDLQQQM